MSVTVKQCLARQREASVTLGNRHDNKLSHMDDSHPPAIDRDQSEDHALAAAGAASVADIMRAELASVLSSPDFLRAPTMNRLLTYLVTETAEGRADQLKAYSVAVDGLGRVSDYDARADSYPRVQVGRLRRMLETYYASTPTADGFRLTIPSGRYRVSLVADAAAPPEALDDQPPAPQRVTAGDVVRMVALLALLVAIAALAARYAPTSPTPDHSNGRRPLLEFTEISDGPTQSLRGDLVGATLVNGLGRSDMFDLRIARRKNDDRTGQTPARYRLSTDLLDGPRPRLFLRLWQQGPDRLIWSGDVALPPASAPEQMVEDSLAPVIATIGRVNGLIAMQESQRWRNEAPFGYGCILLYQHYRKERLASEREPVRECVDRSIRLDPDNAAMQAVAAQLALDRMASSRTPAAERASLSGVALRHAQLALSIEPLNAWAIIARARIAAMRGACSLAIRNALRASELQPYDPTMLSDVGVVLLNCSDRRAEQMLRRAIALDDGTDGQFYRPLLLFAISRDDRQMAREALSAMSPPVLGRHAYFHLVTASGYAMIGDLPRARSAWRQLRASSAAIAGDPQGYLGRLGFAEPIKQKAIEHLRKARLIA